MSIYLLLELLCYALQFYFHLIKWVKIFFMSLEAAQWDLTAQNSLVCGC